MKFITHPLVLYGEFLLERFDKALADVTERSDKIGKDPYIHMLESLRNDFTIGMLSLRPHETVKRRLFDYRWAFQRHYRTVLSSGTLDSA